MEETLYDQPLPGLEALVCSYGQPAFRAKQLYRHLYVNLTPAIAEMTDLPRAFRDQLHADVPLSGLTCTRLQQSQDGMTKKALFTLPDGVTIETVLMAYHDRSTVCVSTQAGCAMGCMFCATGSLGLQRNLTTGEMIQQVVWAAQTIKTHNASHPTNSLSPSLNVVFMGMGEPFANYEQWWQTIERLHDPKGMNMGARKMTVSTVGVVPGIERLTYEALPINLAISLHAPNDEMRTQLVPLNQRYPIAAILEAAQAYTSHTGRRVSFEYVLIQGYNDQPAHAEELARTLRSVAVAGETLLFHINLIPWNPIPGHTLHRSHQQQALAFQQVITRHHIACSIRVERGTEIAAACGQLAGGGGGR